jgi:hypothetical protein
VVGSSLFLEEFLGERKVEVAYQQYGYLLVRARKEGLVVS